MVIADAVVDEAKVPMGHLVEAPAGHNEDVPIERHIVVAAVAALAVEVMALGKVPAAEHPVHHAAPAVAAAHR